MIQLEPLPLGVRLIETLEAGAPFVHIFVTGRAELAARFAVLKTHLDLNGMPWVSRAKKAARLDTDLDENIVRAIGLENGLVDVKVAAVDEIWSGLKFVYRVADRKPAKDNL